MQMNELILMWASLAPQVLIKMATSECKTKKKNFTETEIDVLVGEVEMRKIV